MSEQKNVTKDKAVQAAIRDGIEVGVKTEVVEIYEDLLHTIWDKIAPTLGTVTTAAILKRAVHRTKTEYSLFDYLQVTPEEGLVFDELKSHIGEKDSEALMSGFKELIANLFDILARLTGNILVGELMKVIEGKNMDVGSFLVGAAAAQRKDR